MGFRIAFGWFGTVAAANLRAVAFKDALPNYGVAGGTVRLAISLLCVVLDGVFGA